MPGACALRCSSQACRQLSPAGNHRLLAPNSPLRAAVTALAAPAKPATAQAEPVIAGEGVPGMVPVGNAIQTQPEPVLPKRSPAHYLWAALTSD